MNVEVSGITAPYAIVQGLRRSAGEQYSPL